MKYGKIILTLAALVAVVGGALAFKADRANLKLYYINEGQVCKAVTGLTITTTSTANAALPADGVTGWYTTSVCTSPITYATTINN